MSLPPLLDNALDDTPVTNDRGDRRRFHPGSGTALSSAKALCTLYMC